MTEIKASDIPGLFKIGSMQSRAAIQHLEYRNGTGRGRVKYYKLDEVRAAIKHWRATEKDRVNAAIDKRRVTHKRKQTIICQPKIDWRVIQVSR